MDERKISFMKIDTFPHTSPAKACAHALKILTCFNQKILPCHDWSISVSPKIILSDELDYFC